MRVGNRCSRRTPTWARCRRCTPRRRTLPGDTYIGPGGVGEMRGYPTLAGRSAAAKDAETARRLWELSEELTGVRFPLARNCRR